MNTIKAEVGGKVAAFGYIHTTFKTIDCIHPIKETGMIHNTVGGYACDGERFTSTLHHKRYITVLYDGKLVEGLFMC